MNRTLDGGADFMSFMLSYEWHKQHGSRNQELHLLLSFPVLEGNHLSLDPTDI